MDRNSMASTLHVYTPCKWRAKRAKMMKNCPTTDWFSFNELNLAEKQLVVSYRITFVGAHLNRVCPPCAPPGAQPFSKVGGHVPPRAQWWRRLWWCFNVLTEGLCIHTLRRCEIYIKFMFSWHFHYWSAKPTFFVRNVRGWYRLFIHTKIA